MASSSLQKAEKDLLDVKARLTAALSLDKKYQQEASELRAKGAEKEEAELDEKITQNLEGMFALLHEQREAQRRVSYERGLAWVKSFFVTSASKKPLLKPEACKGLSEQERLRRVEQLHLT
eukprot:CAMPEP_0196720228 /NCGR_PEP_ID=MMETSP1091-20130531/3046_1 /TAXON_ID=302021 /ORGANISM="Rhodomonas sp., Strain CCMP768" /LENGTH=120 /DNA_ID=CAMNT_0042061385 /DNA_START=53 /DNA_END=415 /DNA_ORIENTATION=+